MTETKEKAPSPAPPTPPAKDDDGSGIPPGMGDECCTDQPLDKDATKSSGEMIKLADVDCYITKPSDYPHSNSKLLLFLTNGVGIQSLNNQLQADSYAKEGYVVVMPDMFEGDSAPAAGTTTTEEVQEETSMLDSIKQRAAEGVKAFMIAYNIPGLDIWLARHTAEKTFPIIEKTLKAAKEEFADAASQVFALGYCFGGKYVVQLAATESIVAGALAHGTMVTLDDIKAIKKPVSFVCVKGDGLFPDEIREEGEKYLQQMGIEHEMKVYEGVPHGFAVMGSYHDQHIADSQKKANDQLLGWLKSHETS